MLLARFLPPLAWTALIAWFSTSTWGAPTTAALLLPLFRELFPWSSPEQLDALHGIVRKGAHVFEYAVLAGLWWWSLGRRRGAGAIALAICVATASLDELHQSTTLTRTGSPADVLLDSAAAASALVALATGRAVLDRLIGALLWIAAAGGGALLAVNWMSAAPAGWLWLSVPAAWIGLLARRARRRRA